MCQNKNPFSTEKKKKTVRLLQYPSFVVTIISILLKNVCTWNGIMVTKREIQLDKSRSFNIVYWYRLRDLEKKQTLYILQTYVALGEE